MVTHRFYSLFFAFVHDATPHTMHGYAIEVTPFLDGISITGKEKQYQIVATWDIFVMLDPPSIPTILGEQVNTPFTRNGNSG